jgi:hypothetical protein
MFFLLFYIRAQVKGFFIGLSKEFSKEVSTEVLQGFFEEFPRGALSLSLLLVFLYIHREREEDEEEGVERERERPPIRRKEKEQGREGEGGILSYRIDNDKALRASVDPNLTRDQ